MIRSMTGFSQTENGESGYSLSLTLKGTNHRYLDVQTRVPPGFEFLDPEIRRLVKQHVRRGHVEISASVENENGAALRVNRKLLAAYLKVCQDAQEEFRLTSEPDIVALLRIPGVTGGGELTQGEREAIMLVLTRGLERALAQFNDMREREGAELARDLDERLSTLRVLTETATRLADSVAGALRERIGKRVFELAADARVEPGRLAQEVVMLTMRCDITEELTRLGSHIQQATRLLSESEEVGKRFDFLLQEMNREANTILSKTTDVPGVGAQIQDAAIGMKVEIEKLREQVQNIE